MAKKKWYVVWEGRTPGIYTTWPDCQKQVMGFSGARYKSFGSAIAAQEAFDSGGSETGVSTSSKETGSKPVVPSLSVDAACSGNPGEMEYQAVWVETGEQLFHRGPFPVGTNNIGEFLGLVEGIRVLQSKGKDVPLYTDSNTALAWLRKGKAKTTLKQDAATAHLFSLLDEAHEWLSQNKVTTKILKWETESWGEIPADFGRK